MEFYQWPTSGCCGAGGSPWPGAAGSCTATRGATWKRSTRGWNSGSSSSPATATTAGWRGRDSENAAAIRDTLRAPAPPAANQDCEYCRFAAGAAGA